MLYTQADLDTVRAQIRKILWILLLPCALLLGAIVYSLAVRTPEYSLEWLTITATIVLGALLIFSYGLFLSPLRAYRKHVEAMLGGRYREIAGEFDRMDEQPAMVEGVSFYAFYINVTRRGDEEGERLLYFDASKPRPDWTPGDRLAFRIHDKAVIQWEAK